MLDVDKLFDDFRSQTQDLRNLINYEEDEANSLKESLLDKKDEFFSFLEGKILCDDESIIKVLKVEQGRVRYVAVSEEGLTYDSTEIDYLLANYEDDELTLEDFNKAVDKLCNEVKKSVE